MSELLKNVRPFDYVLAGLMSVAGIFLMWENINATAESDLAHPVSTTTWWMLPAFLLVTVPILWRRRNVLVVTGVTVLTTAAHVLAFGWVTRCGVELPISFALAYAIARFAGNMRNQAIGLAGVLILQIVTLAQDSSTGGLPS